jgi:hypothetical protein
MTTSIRIAAALAVALFGAAASRTAQAEHDHYETIDALAHEAQDLTRALSSEARRHLAGTSEYRAIQSDIGAAYQLASRISAGAHQHGSPVQLHRDADRLHDHVHHIEEHLDEVRHIGYHGSHGHFHTHRVDVRHLRQILDRLDNLCSRLDREIHELDDHGFYSAPGPVYRPGLSVRPGGISFGGYQIQLSR